MAAGRISSLLPSYCWHCCHQSTTLLPCALSRPAGDPASHTKNKEVQQVEYGMKYDFNNFHYRFREACGNDSNAGNQGIPGSPSWLRDVDASERSLHDSMVLFIGMATEMLGKNPKFQQDMRRGLLTVMLPCEATRCMNVLGVIGVALGYAGWLEMLASFFILAIYLHTRPKERITPSQLMAVITDAPEIPTPGDTIPSQGGKGSDQGSGANGVASRDEAHVRDFAPSGMPSLPVTM
jgi:hypothetical protein